MTNRKKKMYYNYNIRTKGGFMDAVFLSCLMLITGLIILFFLGGIR